MSRSAGPISDLKPRTKAESDSFAALSTPSALNLPLVPASAVRTKAFFTPETTFRAPLRSPSDTAAGAAFNVALMAAPLPRCVLSAPSVTFLARPSLCMAVRPSRCQVCFWKTRPTLWMRGMTAPLAE
jgi:hypothetical protein